MKYYPGGDLDFQLNLLLNRGITLTDNVNGGLLSIVTNGSEQKVIHGIGRVPVGFIILSTDDPDYATELANRIPTLGFIEREDEFLSVEEIKDLSQPPPRILWVSRVSEWTNEILYCRSHVANLKVRLFVL